MASANKKTDVKEVKRYWDDRAHKLKEKPAATTDDVHLRELEIATLISEIKLLGIEAGGWVLDVGCGNGYSTMRIAQNLSGVNFVGIDYSENMIAAARDQLEREPSLRRRLNFAVGDVTKLDEMDLARKYDVVISDRCLINLATSEQQALAAAQIAKVLAPGGYYIAVENFVEGQENMNGARKSMGLTEIPVRWHNLFFSEANFKSATEPFFRALEYKDFASSYYFATRIIYSAMCKMTGEEIDYDHAIHRLAPSLPWQGKFSPVRIVVLRRKDSGEDA